MQCLIHQSGLVESISLYSAPMKLYSSRFFRPLQEPPIIHPSGVFLPIRPTPSVLVYPFIHI
jgi:hypothetical protein